MQGRNIPIASSQNKVSLLFFKDYEKMTQRSIFSLGMANLCLGNHENNNKGPRRLLSTL